MKYWIGRFGMVILLLIAVSMATFAALNFLGDPLFNVLGPKAFDTDNPESVALIEQAEAQYYLDKSLPERYVRWLSDFVTGDMGVQFSSDGQPPVTDLIKERLPRTVLLAVMAQFIALAIAIPWGVLSASRANSRVDRASTFASFGFISMPNFALALILLYVFGIRLDWFPDTFNAQDPFFSRMWQTTLPAITLALPAAATYQRLLRTDLITTLQEDFVLMARSKGVSRRAVLFRHALRPSLFSVLTIFGINMGALLGGTVIIERVFRIPGIGNSLIEGIIRDDFPLVLAIVMIVASAFVILNFLVDLLYSVLDPRVRR